MISYRTLVFGTIAVVCAAAPAYADSASAKPYMHTMDSASAKPMDSASAKPLDSASAKPLDSASAKPLDSASAKPKIVRLSGIAGLENLVFELTWFGGIIQH